MKPARLNLNSNPIMSNPVISIIQNPNKKCCATCQHAHLVSYDPYDPLLAECHKQPRHDNIAHPYVVMIANSQQCKLHAFRQDTAEIEQRPKRHHNF